MENSFSPNSGHIFSRVSDVLENHKGFFFVGAGISLDSGLPSWSQLVENCVKEKLSGEASSKELARIFNADEGSLNLIDHSLLDLTKEEELDLLRKALFSGKKNWSEINKTFSPSKTHFLLVTVAKALKVPIVTLNFDHLLKKACELLKIPVKVIYTDAQLEDLYKKDDIGFCIIHVHGYVGKNNSSGSQNIVAGQLHYYREYNSSSGSSKLVSKLLKDRTAVFIGLSLTDHNLNRLLFSLRQNREKHLWLTQYAEFSQFHRKQHQKFWNNLGVEPLYCSSDFTEIYSTLRRIANLKSPRAIKTSRSQKASRDMLRRIYDSSLSLKMFDAFDNFEIDLYEDSSTSHAIRVTRKFTCRTKDVISPKAREFSLSWENGEILQDDSAVSYVMDSLSTHTYIKTSQDRMRSKCLIIIPFFHPELGRCSEIIVFKYLNNNNRLERELHQRSGQSQYWNDIKKLVAYVVKECNL